MIDWVGFLKKKKFFVQKYLKLWSFKIVLIFFSFNTSKIDSDALNHVLWTSTISGLKLSINLVSLSLLSLLLLLKNKGSLFIDKKTLFNK